MQDHTTEQELKDRLSLIESMIAEGRRNTESWGWTFVLWGVVYYLAIAWSAWGHRVWAWPVTILIAVIVTVVVASLKAGNHPETTLGRAIGSIWIALGISMFLLFLALGLSGRLTDQHVFVAVSNGDTWHGQRILSAAAAQTAPCNRRLSLPELNPMVYGRLGGYVAICKLRRWSFQ